MTLADKIAMGQMMLAVGVAPLRGTTTAKARRKIYLSSQHSSLALRSALWRLERAQAAQALTEAANARDFAESVLGVAMATIADIRAASEMLKKGEEDKT